MYKSPAFTNYTFAFLQCIKVRLARNLYGFFHKSLNIKDLGHTGPCRRSASRWLSGTYENSLYIQFRHLQTI